MEVIDLREKIAKSEFSAWFNSTEVSVNYSYINFSIDLKSISAIYSFMKDQAEGWTNIKDVPDNFKQSQVYFKKLKDDIVGFVNTNINANDESTLDQKWVNISNRIGGSTKKYFTYDSPQTKFLLDIHSESPNYFNGAYQFIIGSYRIGNRNEFIGALMAYEFESADFTKILDRREYEEHSINELRNKFNKHLVESEGQLTKYLTQSSTNFTEYTNGFDELVVAKDELFLEWFENSKTSFSTFDADARNKISDLEKTYEELLRLKKPAEYWKIRALELKKEGWKAIYWLIALVGFACVTLYLLLWLTPEGMLLSFIKGNSQAIKWSIIYVTFISFLAYGIKALHKVAFSSFHLARDSEEREQLSYFYLALIKDNAVDEKDKNLIMQSLFSRADTGLLKEESTPTMPNNIASKIFGK